jgi:hypothetical protein
VTKSPQEVEWSKEFEKIGETEIRNDLNFRTGVNVGINSEAKRQYAFRWLRGKEQEWAARGREPFLAIR